MKKLVYVIFAIAIGFLVNANVAKAESYTITQDDFNAARTSETSIKGITYSTESYSPTFVLESGDYTIGSNVTFGENESISIAESSTVNIDLAGKTLAQANESFGALINNEGSLTVKGNGTIETFTSDWGYTNSSFDANNGSLTIENGTFAGGIYAQDATITIKGGTFGSSSFCNDSIVTITDGIFSGISTTNAKSLTITGGTFNGEIAGLMITVSESQPSIKISGGKFTSSGDESKSAIFAMLFDGSTTYDFTKILADGYKFSSDYTVVNENGESPGEIFSYMSVKTISVVPKESNQQPTDNNENQQENNETSNIIVEAASTNEADLSAKQEVTKLVEKVVDDKAVIGMSNELKNEIKQAVADGKTITVDLELPSIDEKKVEEDAYKIKVLVGEDSKVAGYYDITLAVKIDGTKKGNVTELDNKISITLPIPNDINEVASGYDRTFIVVRVHNGIAEELETTLNPDGTITFKTDKFSTYAITYKDTVKKTTTTTKTIANPNTSDNIIMYIIAGIISIIGIISVSALNKRNA